MLEKTLFFVKNKNLADSKNIYSYIQMSLKDDTSLVVQGREIISLPENFWLEFYAHVGENFPEVLTKMAKDFANKPIEASVLVGEDIIKRTKKLVGPTVYSKNPNWTVRGIWGPYELPHTVVHASDLEGVERDLGVFNKYRIEAHD